METTTDAPSRNRTITLVAWVVIVVAVVVSAWRAAASPGKTDTSAAALEIAGRTMIGGRSFGRLGGTAHRGEVDKLDVGPLPVRQRVAVLAAELLGTADAHARLASFAGEAASAGGNAARAQQILLALYPESPPTDETQAARAAALSDDDRRFLAAWLGWYGKLAAAPDGGDPQLRAAVLGSARTSMVAAIAVMGVACTLLPAGLVLLVVALILALNGKFRFLNDVPAGRASFGAETFAVWIVLFVGLQALSALVPDGAARWTAMLVAQAASLGALAVPVMRGVPWPELRRRLGLHRGAGVVREVGAGVVGWIAAIPFIAAGVAVMLAVQQLSGRAMTPGEGGHPIVKFLSGAGAGSTLMLFLLASVGAPIVEETMFRGVLYGHLREATSRWARVASVIASSLAVSVLFAAVHPQGWIAVPVLSAIAMALTLVREWRGSLIAPMVAHGLSNGLVLAFARLALARDG